MFILCKDCDCSIKDITDVYKRKKYIDYCNKFVFEYNTTGTIKLSPLEQDMIDKYGDYWVNAGRTL